MNDWLHNKKKFALQLGGFYLFLYLSGLFFSPVFKNLHDEVRESACFSNQRQIGLALTQYSDDNNGYLPPVRPNDWSHTWRNSITPYVGSKSVFQCPARYDDAIGPDGVYDDYSANCSPNAAFVPDGFNRIRLKDLDEPDALILTFESEGNGPGLDVDDPHHDPFGQWMWAGHSGGASYLMADGHAQWMRPSQTSAYAIGNSNEKINLWYNDSAAPLSPPGIWLIKHVRTDEQ